RRDPARLRGELHDHLHCAGRPHLRLLLHADAHHQRAGGLRRRARDVALGDPRADRRRLPDPRLLHGPDRDPDPDRAGGAAGDHLARLRPRLVRGGGGRDRRGRHGDAAAGAQRLRRGALHSATDRRGLPRHLPALLGAPGRHHDPVRLPVARHLAAIDDDGAMRATPGTGSFRSGHQWPMAMRRQFMKTSLIGAALAAAVFAAPASAQQTFRVGDSFPTGHYIAENTIKPFMAEVEKRMNGQVKFEYYPAQQLGKAKDLMSLALSGVADIAYVAPSFVTDKPPLSVVAELPEAFDASCHGTRAYWKLVKEGGLLD